MAHLEFMATAAGSGSTSSWTATTVEFGGVSVRPFRLAEDYVYAFELSEGNRRLLLAMDELDRLVAHLPSCAVAISPCCRWGSASSIRSPASG